MRAHTIMLATIAATAVMLPGLTTAFEVRQHSLALAPGQVNTVDLRNRFDYPIIVRLRAVADDESRADISDQLQIFPRRVVLLPGQLQRIKVRAQGAGEARLAMTHAPRKPRKGQHARLTLTIPVRSQEVR